MRKHEQVMRYQWVPGLYKAITWSSEDTLVEYDVKQEFVYPILYEARTFDVEELDIASMTGTLRFQHRKALIEHILRRNCPPEPYRLYMFDFNKEVWDYGYS